MDTQTVDTQVQKRVHRPFSKKSIIISLLAFILILLVVFIQLAYMTFSYDRIFKGVFINGISAGEMTPEEARTVLESTYNDKFPDMLITLKSGNSVAALSYKELGANYNVDLALDSAYAVGREGNIFRRFADILNSRRIGASIEIPVTYDNQKVDLLVQSLYVKTLIPVNEVQCTVQEDKAIFTPGRHGENIDKDAARAEVEKHLKELSYGVIDVPIVITSPGRIDIDEYYKLLTREVKDAKTEVTDNKVNIIPHQTGKSIDKNALISISDELYEMDGGAPLTIDIATVQPGYTTEDVQALLFRDELHTASSRYKSDTQSNKNRTENLRISSSKINGKILGPGEIFSFNGVVGKRTVEDGYKDAYVFVGGEVVPDLAGGICQVSSTLYNAALYSDLEIVERRNHQFIVSYVPQGQDATVYYGQTDFRFKNSTPWPIRIDSWMAGNTLYFRLVGTNTNPGKTIELKSEVKKFTPRKIVYADDPTLPAGRTIIKQPGYDGYVVDLYKITKQDGKVIKTEKITTSTYKPLEKLIVRGTKKPVEKPIEKPVEKPAEAPEEVPAEASSGTEPATQEESGTNQ